MFSVGCIIFKRGESYNKFEGVRHEAWKSLRRAELPASLQVTTNFFAFQAVWYNPPVLGHRRRKTTHGTLVPWYVATSTGHISTHADVVNSLGV
jgi:hypothetical protein